MKISELIQELERLKAEHGDLPVYAFSCQDETASDVGEIYYSDWFNNPHVTIVP